MMCKDCDITGMELKIMRIKRGLKQYSIASAVGITQPELSQIEGDRKKPTPELLTKILEALRNDKPANH